MSRAERLKIVSDAVALFDHEEWTSPRVNMVLAGFGLDEVTGWDNFYEFFDAVRRLQATDDRTLTETAEHLGFGVPSPSDRTFDDHGLWREDAVRVFLSHSAKYKALVAEVAAAAT